MKTHIYFLTHDGWAFNAQEKHAIRNVINAAAKRADKRLRLPKEMNVTVNPDADFIVPETGEGGFTASADWIQIALDPDRRRLQTIIKTNLPSGVSHELLHAARLYAGMEGDRLIDEVIEEGLATVFEMEQAPDVTPPWANPPKQLKAQLSQLQRVWKRTDYDYMHYFDRESPKWLGYKIGTWIVQEAKRHSGKTAADMALYRAEDVVALSQNKKTTDR